MATVTFSAADDLLYAYLAGEIDHDAAQDLRIQLDDALLTRTPHTLVLDLGGVGFMDSSGVGLILGRQRCARSSAGPCASSTPRNSCAVCCGLRAFRARTSPAGKNRRNEDESGKHHKNSI